LWNQLVDDQLEGVYGVGHLSNSLSGSSDPAGSTIEQFEVASSGRKQQTIASIGFLVRAMESNPRPESWKIDIEIHSVRFVVLSRQSRRPLPMT